MTRRTELLSNDILFVCAQAVFPALIDMLTEKKREKMNIILYFS